MYLCLSVSFLCSACYLFCQNVLLAELHGCCVAAAVPNSRGSSHAHRGMEMREVPAAILQKPQAKNR